MLNALLQKISEKKEIRVAVIGAGVLVVLAVVFLVYRSFSTRPAPVAVTQPVVEETMKKETTADTRMFFDQGAVTAKSGETFSVTVMIDPGVNRVSGTDFEVGYDAKKLKLEKIAPSDVFPLGLREAKIDNVKGTGSIAIAAPLEKSSVGESAAVATLMFRALQSGTVTVTFSGNTIIAADNEPGNVVKEKVPVTVTIEGK